VASRLGDEHGPAGLMIAKLLTSGSPQLGVGRKRPGGRPHPKRGTAYGRRGKPRPPASSAYRPSHRPGDDDEHNQVTRSVNR
jgi:hypothetical protein